MHNARPLLAIGLLTALGVTGARAEVEPAQPCVSSDHPFSIIVRTGMPGAMVSTGIAGEPQGRSAFWLATLEKMLADGLKSANSAIVAETRCRLGVVYAAQARLMVAPARTAHFALAQVKTAGKSIVSRHAFSKMVYRVAGHSRHLHGAAI